MGKLFQQVMKKPHDFPAPEWTPISAEAKDLINKVRFDRCFPIEFIAASLCLACWPIPLVVRVVGKAPKDVAGWTSLDGHARVAV